MNFRHAQYISVIAEEGSITAAARRLHVSQPSLSQMIRQIEEEYGVALFDRSTLPIRLTYAGEKYVECANTLLTASRKLENQLRDIREENSGRLRLGISVQRSMMILPAVLPVFRERYPGIRLEIREAGSARLEEMLRLGEIDLGLAAVESASLDFSYSLIEKETIGILAGSGSGPAKKHKNGVPLSVLELAKEQIVTLKPGHSVRVVQDSLFRKYALKPYVLLETDSMEVARRVTSAVGACMLCSDIYYYGAVKESAKFFPLKDYRNERHYYAIWRKDEDLPRYAEAFITLLRDSLGNTPHAGKEAAK